MRSRVLVSPPQGRLAQATASALDAQCNCRSRHTACYGSAIGGPREPSSTVVLHLVCRRSAARRLQAVRLRQGHPAFHRPSAPGLRAGAHQGHGARRVCTREQQGVNPEPFLLRAAGQTFYQHVAAGHAKLMGDQDHIRQNLYAYIQGFSPAVRDIFERFDFAAQIDGSPRPTCSIRSPRSSPASTCTRTRSTTRRWASCSRS